MAKKKAGVVLWLLAYLPFFMLSSAIRWIEWFAVKPMEFFENKAVETWEKIHEERT